jgi:hypothetical protein
MFSTYSPGCALFIFGGAIFLPVLSELPGVVVLEGAVPVVPHAEEREQPAVEVAAAGGNEVAYARLNSVPSLALVPGRECRELSSRESCS